MKKSNYMFIIVFSTFISSINMLYQNIYLTNSNHYVQGKSIKEEEVGHDKAYIKSIDTTNNADVEIIGRNDEIITNNNGYVENDRIPKAQSNNDYKGEHKKNGTSFNGGLPNEDIKKDDKTKESNKEVGMKPGSDSIENYYDYIKENEQAVFKVSTGKILGSLTTSDKIKLFYVSMHLDKEEYKKVEKYLYAEDAEDGVLKALKLLREDLSEKEYEKVRKIAGRFINMDMAEKLN